jgi:cytochrome b involved in lipid metabolism
MVYDVTDYIKHHPGGRTCLLTRIKGGVDATADYQFHSKKAHHVWEKYRIGKLTRCNQSDTNHSCSLM